MGLFKKRSSDPAEMDRLKSDLAAMAARLDAIDAARDELGHRVHRLATKLDAPPPEPPPPPPPAATPADIDMLRARIQRLSDRIEDSTGSSIEPGVDPALLEQLNARIDAVAQRLDQAIDDGPDEQPIDPAVIHQLHARIEAVSQRLDHAIADAPDDDPIDPAVIDQLHARIEAVSRRLDDAIVETPDDESIDPGELAAVHGRLDALHARISELADSVPSSSPDADQLDELRRKVEALGERFETPITSPPPPPPPPPGVPPPPPAPPAGIDVAEIHTRLDALDERLAHVDARITAISTELANQIGELSDELVSRPSAAATPTGESIESIESIEELREAQERLAQEQARYQIAFRQELAELADRLRRS